MLQPVEAAFDYVAEAVDPPVESGWPTAARAPVEAPEGLVDAFGDRVGDAASSQVAADFSGAVALVGDDVVGPGARTARPVAGNVDRLQDGFEPGAVVRVAAREDEAERAPSPVAGQVELGA